MYSVRMDTPRKPKLHTSVNVSKVAHQQFVVTQLHLSAVVGRRLSLSDLILIATVLIDRHEDEAVTEANRLCQQSE